MSQSSDSAKRGSQRSLWSSPSSGERRFRALFAADAKELREAPTRYGSPGAISFPAVSPAGAAYGGRELSSMSTLTATLVTVS